MAESIAKRSNSLVTAKDGEALNPLFKAMLADITAIRASLVGINAKLDADAGVTDTNYAALWNPAALTTTK